MDRKRTPVSLIIGIAIAAVAISIGGFFVYRNSSSKKVMDPYLYFNMTETEGAVIRDGAVCEEKAVVNGETVYVPYCTVSDLCGNPFYYEEASETMYLTLQNEDNRWTKENGEYLYFDGGNVCLEAGTLKKYSDCGVSIYTDPLRIVITEQYDDVTQAEVLEDTQVRYESSKKSPILRQVAAGETLRYIADEEPWSRVLTEDGYTGYILTDKISIGRASDLSRGINPLTDYEKIQVDGKVSMVWNQIEVQEGNTYLDEMFEGTYGIGVISPTWFRIADTEGNISSLADMAYVENCRNRGVQIWALIYDYAGEGSTTGEILKDPDARRNLISQLMGEVDEYGLDGINIDFETIAEDEAGAYIQFLRELSVETHRAGIVLSVDDYVPTYTAHYNRACQSKVVDYIIMMGYDEHTPNSAEPGSVASLPFVRDGVEATLKEVPASQLILGVPFYTRSWTEPLNAGYYETEALSMPRAEDFIAEHQIEMYWDSAAGQNVGSAVDDQARYSIWMENRESIEEKLKLAEDYSLAGVSAWRIGYENMDVWETWNAYLNR